MHTQTIAELANVHPSDVSNYRAWVNGDDSRLRYVSPEKRERISKVIKTPKAQLVLMHLQSGQTLTPLESLRLYGLHSLSQTITKLRKRGHDIRNVGDGGPHDYAVYKLHEAKQ